MPSLKRRRQPASNHVGQAGEKLIITVTVHGDTPLDGVSHLCRMTDAQGNVFMWFRTSCRTELTRSYDMRISYEGRGLEMATPLQRLAEVGRYFDSWMRVTRRAC